MAEQLHEARTSLSLQEEVARRTEREKRSLEEEVAQLRITLQAAEAESRALQVCKRQRKSVFTEMPYSIFTDS